MIYTWSITICPKSIRTQIRPKGSKINSSIIISVHRPRSNCQTRTPWAARAWTTTRSRVLWRRCTHKTGCISSRPTFRGRYRTTRAYSRRQVIRWQAKESTRYKEPQLLRRPLGRALRGSHTTRLRSRSKEEDRVTQTQWRRWSSTTCPKYRLSISNLKAIRRNTSREWWGHRPDPSPQYQLIYPDRPITITHSKL